MQQITVPELKEGEIYAGIILKEDGTPDYHLVLLPGEVEDKEWQQAIDWAVEQGGELPTRNEQSLLFANAKQHFQKDWYWSGTQHASISDYAWCQDFSDGSQLTIIKDYELRTRAVRRLPI